MKDRVVLAVTVEGEGLGDFTHFHEIYTALKNNSKLNNIEFIPLVFCAHSPKSEAYKKIEHQLKELGIPYHLLTVSDTYHPTYKKRLPDSIQEELRKSSQLIVVSSITTLDTLRPYKDENIINPKAVIKYIGEHEQASHNIYAECLSLGLDPKIYIGGIKIKKITPRTEEQAYTVLKDNDRDFIEVLLKKTQSSKLDEFRQKNILVPAYFQGRNIDRFMRFLTLLAINRSISNDKDIAVYLSSGDIKLFKEKFSRYLAYLYKNQDLSDLEKSDIKQIEIITRDGQIQVYPPPSKINVINDEEIKEVEWSGPAIAPKSKGRIIRVFCDQFLKASSYEALYQVAPIAAVTGDNTLELAISTDTFPYYISTNFTIKYPTLIGIYNIIKDLNMPNEVKENYLIYFNYKEFRDFANPEGREINKGQRIKFESLDFNAMREWWPVVSKHIKTHHNYYDNLEAFFLKGFTLQVYSDEKGEEANKENSPVNMEFPEKPIPSTGQISASLERIMKIVMDAVNNDLTQKSKAQTEIDLAYKEKILKAVHTLLGFAKSNLIPERDKKLIVNAKASLEKSIVALREKLSEQHTLTSSLQQSESVITKKPRAKGL